MLYNNYSKPAYTSNLYNAGYMPYQQNIPQYSNMAYMQNQQIQPNQIQQPNVVSQVDNQQFNNQYSQSPQSSIPQFPSNKNISTNDIVWVTSEQEVFNYPVGVNDNCLFINMNEMRMYTKEGSTGLVRDFEICETPDSIKRYQQLQQTINMQFPVVDTNATEVDSEIRSQEILNNIEQKLEEKFNDFEQRFSELSKSLGNNTENNITTKTTSKPMAKRGGN